jgi:hypothetical protein
MSRKYVNGSDKCRFILVSPGGGQEIIDLEFTYQALKEYDICEATKIVLINGKKKKKPRYINLEWELDCSEYFAGEDSNNQQLAVQRIKNAEFEGKQIILIPHIDQPWRNFKVQIVEEQRELAQYYNLDMDGPNFSYVIKFENIDPITAYNWSDPNFLPLITTISAEEF